MLEGHIIFCRYFDPALRLKIRLPEFAVLLPFEPAIIFFSTKTSQLYMTTELIAHAGRGGFETRPYRPALTGMPAINMRIF